MQIQRLFPRWGVLAIDLVLCCAALASAYLLRFNFQVPQYEVDLLLPVLPLFLGIRLLSFLVFGTHRLMVRHTNTDDARLLFLTALAGSIALALASAVRYYLIDDLYVLPRAVIVIDFLATAMLLIGVRIAFKLRYLRKQGKGKAEQRVLIYGAGEAGLITKRTLERASTVHYTVAGFVDDAPRNAGRTLEGATVYHTDKLPALLSNSDIQQVIIAIASPHPEQRRRVVDACIEAQVQVLTIPPVSDWINGQLSAGQIQEVRIEDLLGRPVIHLEQAGVQALFAGKRVLVTGAAGSIGSELARQLASLSVESLVLVDLAESGLYDLDMELQGKGLGKGVSTVIGDVRQHAALDRIFATHRPQVVFHAAAYKHVPMMEAQPGEAIATNIIGSRNAADLACAYGVEKFILISTDKAVNPTSVMGASKRIAELVVSSVDAGCSCQFITTRFGNVLGSSGSVIPLFRKQIAAGGPVTVTHPEVTRFFMTIPEACRLVLEAAVMGHGGEIFVFDMGEPVRIADLAEKMIRLSGLKSVATAEELGEGRIQLSYTGLRPGEKLYEELLATAENTLATHHPRILIGQVRPVNTEETRDQVDALISMLDHASTEEQVRQMKRLVPEYRSHNSVFSSFDAE